MSPERIYLRHYNDSQTSPIDPHTLRLWRLGDGDIEYIRADLTSPTPSLAAASDLDLDAIEARANAATPGPWFNAQAQDGEILPDGSGYAGDYYDTTEIAAHREDEPECFIGQIDGEANRAFVIHARTDIHALIAEVRRLRALPSPAAPGKKGKEDGGPVATLPEASPRVERVQFTSFDDGLHPECDNAEYLEYETRKNTLTGEMVIISYGYRRVWPNGRYEWIKKAEAKGGAA